MSDKAAINARFSELYDQGMAEGKHGHYETCFRAMHEAYAPVIEKLMQEMTIYKREADELWHRTHPESMGY